MDRKKKYATARCRIQINSNIYIRRATTMEQEGFLPRRFSLYPMKEGERKKKEQQWIDNTYFYHFTVEIANTVKRSMRIDASI